MENLLKKVNSAIENTSDVVITTDDLYQMQKLIKRAIYQETAVTTSSQYCAVCKKKQSQKNTYCSACGQRLKPYNYIRASAIIRKDMPMDDV